MKRILELRQTFFYGVGDETGCLICLCMIVYLRPGRSVSDEAERSMISKLKSNSAANRHRPQNRT